MKSSMHLVAFATLALGLILPGTGALGATLRVPQDHATITAAIAAAGSGDVVTITNSTTYTETLVFDKALTLRAEAGHTPVIHSPAGINALMAINDAADGLKIGDAAGGRITLSALGTTTLYGILFTTGASGIVIENLDMRYPSSGGTYVLDFQGPNISATFSRVDTFAYYRGLELTDGDNASGGSVIFEYCNIDTSGIGSFNEILRLRTTTSHLASAIFRNCKLSSDNAVVDVSSYLADTVVTLENCFLVNNLVDNILVYNCSPTVDITMNDCALLSRGNGVWYNYTGGPTLAFDAFTLLIDHCDLWGNYMHPTGIYSVVQIEPGAGRNITIKSTNVLSPDLTTEGIDMFNDNLADDTIVMNYNNVQAYENGAPQGANDKSPMVQPNYAQPEMGDFTYTVASLITSGEGGTPIGSNTNFPLTVPVELSTFQLQ